MAKYARYTVIVERQLGESDGSGVYHDGSGKAAVAQLANELQEAWDSGSVAGFFRVVHRQIIDTDTAIDLSEIDTNYEDEPDTPIALHGS